MQCLAITCTGSAIATAATSPSSSTACSTPSRCEVRLSFRVLLTTAGTSNYGTIVLAGVSVDGIYRVSGNMADIQKLRLQVDSGSLHISRFLLVFEDIFELTDVTVAMYRCYVRPQQSAVGGARADRCSQDVFPRASRAAHSVRLLRQVSRRSQ